MSPSITAEKEINARRKWTPEERRNALINNGFDSYLVDRSDGSTELLRGTQLSFILQCDNAAAKHDIVKIQQCWNRACERVAG